MAIVITSYIIHEEFYGNIHTARSLFTMSKHYFLSRFTGTGTHRDPFRPLIAKLGTCGMLDLRPDKTRQEGWCFACLNSEHGINLEHSSELIYLGENAHGDLGDSILRQIKNTLGISFKSKTLAELIAEILLFRLMPGHGLRPGLDGVHRSSQRPIMANHRIRGLRICWAASRTRTSQNISK